MVSLQLEAEALKPLIQQVVSEVLARLDSERAKLDGRLAYSEVEAAKMLGLEPHVLRDERLRGNIGASAIVGRRIRYTREDLTGYLLSRRWQKGAQTPTATGNGTLPEQA
jgi:hypothetical protein